MGKPLKVGFATKLLSNRNYLKEVSVEGKTTNKFNFKIGYYDQYAAQIIRSGNCITLLSNDISITKETFWNPNHFEDLTRYVFWTLTKASCLFWSKTLRGYPCLSQTGVPFCCGRTLHLITLISKNLLTRNSVGALLRMSTWLKIPSLNRCML